MSFFAKNIKFLRKRKKLSQNAVAKTLNLTRSSLSGYENATAQAPYDILIKLSEFYNVSLDVILKKDISKISEKKLTNMEGNGNFNDNGPSTSRNDTRLDIELVSMETITLYSKNYNNPEFIKKLPIIKLPFLPENKKHRVFVTTDNSMIPATKGSYIIGEYLNDWNKIEDGKYYIIVTNTKGVLFKQVFKNTSNDKGIQLCSNDPAFEPIDIDVSEIIEIWKFESYISDTFHNNNNSQDNLYHTVKELQRKIYNIEKHLKI